jgi:preprotein translocase subunit SecA
MSRFHVNLPQSQIKKMSKDEVEERLRDTAIEQIDKRDCAGLMKYLDPLFAEGELAQWARDKFDIQIDPKEFLMEDARTRKLADDIVELIQSRARTAYARREIEYPVDHTLTFAFGGEEVSTDNPYAADYVRAWAKMKFGAELTLDHIRSMSVRRLRDELIGLQEKAMVDGGVEAEVDGMLKEGDHAAIARHANARFGGRLTEKDFAPEVSSNGNGEAAAAATKPPRDILLKAAKQFYRKELTDLEQFVLIQIFDQSWKDHLYAMDMLRGGIGLQAFAERDPRILYKKEGYRFFQEMMSGVRDKVTDLIFRARVVGATQARSVYRETSAEHADVGGYGVGENVQRTAAELGAGTAAHHDEGSPSGGGEEGAVKVKQIVNTAPKVGRNDPCPCGSGKKYKKCCGANAA